jgi:hypothetical protein
VTASSAGKSNGAGPVGPSEAEFAVAHLTELSPDLRGCAVIGPGGKVLASSGGSERWADAAAGFLAAADDAAGEPIEHVHVGTEDGEAFAVRSGELAMVAVTDRFTLSSLVLFDIRTILRDLAGGGEVVDRRAGA